MAKYRVHVQVTLDRTYDVERVNSEEEAFNEVEEFEHGDSFKPELIEEYINSVDLDDCYEVKDE